MGRKLEKLVKEKELSNLFIDQAEDILNGLIFDSSSKDNQNQLLFMTCIESSLSYLADEIYKSFEFNLYSSPKFLILTSLIILLMMSTIFYNLSLNLPDYFSIF